MLLPNVTLVENIYFNGKIISVLDREIYTPFKILKSPFILLNNKYEDHTKFTTKFLFDSACFGILGNVPQESFFKNMYKLQQSQAGLYTKYFWELDTKLRIRGSKLNLPIVEMPKYYISFTDKEIGECEISTDSFLTALENLKL